MSNPTGRPTKYKIEYDEQVYKLCLLSATDKSIADFFNVEESTVNNWKIDYPSFLESIKQGKDKADQEVANSLYKRATGYDQKTDKIFQFQGEAVVVPTIEHVQPDTTAQIFWLKNRQPRAWRDKIDINANITNSDTIALSDEQLTAKIKEIAAQINT